VRESQYAARLVLNLACLDDAADPSADPNGVPWADARVVDHAWELIGYFKSHARRLHAAIARGSGIGGGPVVKAIVDWLQAGGRSTFTVRDIKQARRWLTETQLTDCLKFLAERNAIRPLPKQPPGRRGGRPQSTAYEVNPALLNAQNTHNSQNPGPAVASTQGFEGSEGSASE
jgi:hypothetical protein